jgi:undecaprenyl-diphosphatase
MAPSLDLRILLDLNSLVPESNLGRELFNIVGNNPLVRGFPIFVPLVILWFSGGKAERRSRMLTGLLATCFATVLSVSIQHHLITHIRPMLDPELHLRLINPRDGLNWDHLGSFPSDSATLFFSLAMVVFLESRRAGIIAFLWTLISIGAFRVATGWHYPSDIIGGLILGPACVLLFTQSRFIIGAFDRLLLRYETRPYVVNVVLFLFLADAYWLFLGLEGIYGALGHIVRSLTSYL